MSSAYTPLQLEAWRESDYRGNHYVMDIPREGDEKYCAYGTACPMHFTPRFDNDVISSIKVPPMTTVQAYVNDVSGTPVELTTTTSYKSYNKSDLGNRGIHDNISNIVIKPTVDFKKRLATCCVKGPVGEECKMQEGDVTPSSTRCEDIVRDYCADIATKGQTDDDICGCYNIPPEVQSKFDELFGGVSEPPTCWYKPCINALYQPPNWKTHQCRDLKICNQLAGKVDITDFAKLNKAEIGKMSCNIGNGTGTGSTVTPPPPPPTSSSTNTGMIIGIVFVVFIIVVLLIVVAISSGRKNRGGNIEISNII